MHTAYAPDRGYHRLNRGCGGCPKTANRRGKDACRASDGPALHQPRVAGPAGSTTRNAPVRSSAARESPSTSVSRPRGGQDSSPPTSDGRVDGQTRYPNAPDLSQAPHGTGRPRPRRTRFTAAPPSADESPENASSRASAQCSAVPDRAADAGSSTARQPSSTAARRLTSSTSRPGPTRIRRTRCGVLAPSSTRPRVRRPMCACGGSGRRGHPIRTRSGTRPRPASARERPRP